MAKKKAAKKSPAKKKVSKKTTAKKTAPKKKPVKKKVAKKKAPAKKAAKKKTAAKKAAKPAKKKVARKKKKAGLATEARSGTPAILTGAGRSVKAKTPIKKRLDPFTKKQYEKLITLRGGYIEMMDGVAKDTLRSQGDSADSSAFGQHTADAGSDAYDRDFALNILSKEHDALEEIEAAIERIEEGTYGVCEMSKNKIPKPRLEAIPFARYTVECQAQMEREGYRGNQDTNVRSLFGRSDAAPAAEDS